MNAETHRRLATTTPQREGNPGRASNAHQATTSGIDYHLIGVVVTMVLLGLVMVFSASFPVAATHYFLRQMLWIGVGSLAFVIMAMIPYRFWQRMAVPVIAVTIIGLLAVLIIGEVVFGAKRHLLQGSLQPSEIAKLSLTIYVAAWVASRGKKLAGLQEGLLPFTLLMALIGGLIAAERSFSVTIIALVIGLTIYFIGGGRLKHIALILLIGTPILMTAMWQANYPFDRIQGWYNVWFKPAEAPEDLVKLMWMLREGRGSIADPTLWGIKASVTGLWNDYLFANIGADLHLPGTLLVVALYAWFGYRGLSIALNAPDRFGALTAIGLTMWILVQAVIHIGTSLTLIPTTGQPLPFMSHGGSSLVSCMAAAGLLASISRAEKDRKAPYAHFTLGWGDGRPRLPNPDRRRDADRDDRGRGGGQHAATSRRQPAASRQARRPAATTNNRNR